MTLAVLLIDLQRDFISVDGAYARGGVTSPVIATLPGRLQPLVEAARTAGVVVIASQFTLTPVGEGEPIIAPELRRLRPFLGRGDFCPGTPGHGLVDEIRSVDVSVEKVAYSAFHQSRLEWILRGLGVERLLVGGIVTNGGVASTVRDAHTRGFAPTLIADGCAAFSADAHNATMRSLATVLPTTTIAEARQTLLELAQTGCPR